MSDSDLEDSELKQGEIPSMSGMLLYGVNAIGKTCCMKAIGVNLVMAQSGMFVAADSFEYSPYKKILTRILGNDNIFKGLSSFAVEMSELNGIIQRADDHSLILGDEVCHGTETISGVAIVGASLKRLTERKSHFIFATHLHQLVNLDLIKQLPNLGVYHMHMEYDPLNHRLIYFRNLRRGSGNPLYGIEVARAMDLDDKFIKDANQIRQELMEQSQDFLPDRKSRYNAQVYVDKCLLCQTKKAEDTHHIKFQCTADKNGMIGSIHKHEAKNLVPLCKECHVRTHQGYFQINGYLETSQGLLLDYQVKDSNKNSEMKNSQPIPSLSEKIRENPKVKLSFKNLRKKQILGE